MKILIAVDSFKECLDSLGVSKGIGEGIRKVFKDASIEIVPIADGGEGTTEALVHGSSGRLYWESVMGPLGDKVDACFGILGDKKTCVIEMASASGLALVPKEYRNPLKTTTYGTGELIKKGLDMGCRDFIIGIGGSATNDGGMGMAKALGIRFLDHEGQELGLGGEMLKGVSRIDFDGIDERISKSRFSVACDVDNPLCGENGAANIYGRQKGATEDMVEILDSGLENLAEVIYKDTNKDILHLKGAGAAGGLGGGLVAFCDARLSRGMDIVIETLDIANKVREADIVITGEGRIDSQTARGKVPAGIGEIGKKYNKPVIALCGSLSMDARINHEKGIGAMFSILNEPMTLEEAMDRDRALELISYKTEELFRLIKLLNWRP